MIRVALKGLLARRTRSILTALAIVIGVATISAAYTLSDTMRKGADALSSDSYDGTAAAVTARTAFKLSDQSATEAPTVHASLLEQVRAVPQVGAAIGDLTNLTTKIVDAKGEPIGDGPYFGTGLDTHQPGFDRLTPFRLQSGGWAAGPGQVVIDAGTAEKKHYGVGDEVRIAASGPARRYRISGIATFGSVKSIGTATLAIFDVPTAQKVFHKEGRFDAILVGARDGASPAQVRRALAAALPAGVQVRTAAAQDRFTLDGLKQFVNIIEIVLLAFAGVALLVGGFTIFNTLSITVAQRTREFGLLRMVGAERRQVLGTVLAEALAVGLVASLLGLVGGLGLAKALGAVFTAVGLDLPQTGTVFATHTIVISLLVGTLITVLAGLVPAWRATRVAPVAALRDADPNAGRVRLAGRAIRGVAGIVGRPAQLVGGSAGGLARRNAMRNPGRVAVTAAALTIGVALVTAVSVLGQGLKDTTTGSLQKHITATSVVVDKDGWTPIDPQIERTVVATPGVRTATSIRQDSVLAYGQEEGINTLDPARIGKVFDFDWKQGDKSLLAGLGSGGAVIDEGWATEHHLKVGDAFHITSAAGRRLDLEVRGIEKSPVIDALGLGPITISHEAGAAIGLTQTRNKLTLVDAPGASGDAVKRALTAYPAVRVQTTKAYVDEQAASIDQLLAIFDVLLAFAVIVSLFGLVNALVLATFERTREIGMLRAVGMTRRQVRRMVRHESIITAVLGAVTGMGIGLGLAALVVAKWGSTGLAFGLPVGSLIAFAVVAVLAGIVAAILPARRAARMDVLTALAYE
jgi:putative ABC transport system permease protein